MTNTVYEIKKATHALGIATKDYRFPLPLPLSAASLALSLYEPENPFFAAEGMPAPQGYLADRERFLEALLWLQENKQHHQAEKVVAFAGLCANSYDFSTQAALGQQSFVTKLQQLQHGDFFSCYAGWAQHSVTLSFIGEDTQAGKRIHLIYCNRGESAAEEQESRSVSVFSFDTTEQKNTRLFALIQQTLAYQGPSGFTCCDDKTRTRYAALLDELAPYYNSPLSTALWKNPQRFGHCTSANANFTWHLALAAHKMRAKTALSLQNAYQTTRKTYKRLRNIDRILALETLLTHYDSFTKNADELLFAAIAQIEKRILQDQQENPLTAAEVVQHLQQVNAVCLFNLALLLQKRQALSDKEKNTLYTEKVDWQTPLEAVFSKTLHKTVYTNSLLSYKRKSPEHPYYHYIGDLKKNKELPPLQQQDRKSILSKLQTLSNTSMPNRLEHMTCPLPNYRRDRQPGKHRQFMARVFFYGLLALAVAAMVTVGCVFAGPLGGIGLGCAALLIATGLSMGFETFYVDNNHWTDETRQHFGQVSPSTQRIWLPNYRLKKPQSCQERPSSAAHKHKKNK